MSNPRYQVFISSTFRDLKQERQSVLDAILNLGHFPAGMELFPASDSTPWEVIERVIEDSDYYILVVGGMYGSMDSSGISYTEREYDYARRLGTPVLTFLHEDPSLIPSGKVEASDGSRAKLSAFRTKLQSAHHCKYWCDAKDLRYKVAIGLVAEINLNPAVGWIRASDGKEREVAMARMDVREAVEEAKQQHALREAAEQRAQELEAALAALKKDEAAARAEAEAAAVRASAAVARGRAAREVLMELNADTRQDGRRNDGVPTGFVAAAAKDVLAGATDRVTSFVVWSDTPQGHGFWSEQKKRLENRLGLTGDARLAIMQWLQAAQQSD
jgi:Domain of unknown function (DUF4062)